VKGQEKVKENKWFKARGGAIPKEGGGNGEPEELVRGVVKGRGGGRVGMKESMKGSTRVAQAWTIRTERNLALKLGKRTA